jgi:hypothetical protein
MRPASGALAALLALFLFPSAPITAAVINASADTSQPSQSTSYDRTGGSIGGFAIVEDVALNPAAGPWQTSLVNSAQSGVGSGDDLPIAETFTNVGTQSWLRWHEHVASRTTISTTDDTPGFLFRQGSLSVAADYGAGFVTLTQGVDYTLVAPPFPGPQGMMENGGNWESIDIFFQPLRQIASGNKLRINKDIFEVFNDGDPWRPAEAAVISQFPSAVPEPSGGLVCVAVALLAAARRRMER